MIVGRLKEPLVLDVGDDNDIYICRGVNIVVLPCKFQPKELSSSAIREVIEKIKMDSDCRALLDND